MGGKREGAGRHKRDCQCERCLSKYGSRPTDSNVAKRVLAKADAERTWQQLIDYEKKRLGLDGKSKPERGAVNGPDYQGKFSVIPLVNILRYLEDRAYGRPVDTVNHLHDKPLELNATLTLGEGMRLAMEKAEQRVSRGKR